jgi:hypothetical protein
VEAWDCAASAASLSSVAPKLRACKCVAPRSDDATNPSQKIRSVSVALSILLERTKGADEVIQAKEVALPPTHRLGSVSPQREPRMLHGQTHGRAHGRAHGQTHGGRRMGQTHGHLLVIPLLPWHAVSQAVPSLGRRARHGNAIRKIDHPDAGWCTRWDRAVVEDEERRGDDLRMDMGYGVGGCASTYMVECTSEQRMCAQAWRRAWTWAWTWCERPSPMHAHHVSIHCPCPCQCPCPSPCSMRSQRSPPRARRTSRRHRVPF